MLFKQKDSRATNSDRTIKLQQLADYKSIIVIIDKAEQIRHNQLHQLFPSADFSFLTMRTEKEDSSSGKNYTYHKSDKRFGSIKNERLLNLMKLEFDLTIDLSTNESLKYFCKKINAHLKTGCFNAAANYNLDLLVKDNKSVEEIVKDIAEQIKKTDHKQQYMKNIKGLGVAMVTPFSQDKSIDFDGLKKLTHYLIDNGVNYLVVQGTTGESPTLSTEEKIAVLKTVISENAGRLPIVYGIGGNNTMAVAEATKDFDINGVDAILSVSPYYNKPTQEGIYQHFKTISQHSKLPIILYNVPGRTSSNILPNTAIRLANDFENIVAIKEASGNLEQVMSIIKNKPEGFLVISGDDALTQPFIAMGGDGVISVIGNGLPKLFSEMIKAGLDENHVESRKLHYQCFELIHHLFSEGNPAGIKEVLSYYQICENNVRLPLLTVSVDTKRAIVEILDKL